jgi:hypothetical protein
MPKDNTPSEKPVSFSKKKAALLIGAAGLLAGAHALLSTEAGKSLRFSPSARRDLEANASFTGGENATLPTDSPKLQQFLATSEDVLQYPGDRKTRPKNPSNKFLSSSNHAYPAQQTGGFGIPLPLKSQSQLGVFVENAQSVEILFGDLNAAWVKLSFDMKPTRVNPADYAHQDIYTGNRHFYGIYVTTSANPADKRWVGDYADFLTANRADLVARQHGYLPLTVYYLKHGDPDIDGQKYTANGFGIGQPMAYDAQGHSYMPATLQDIPGYVSSAAPFPFNEIKSWSGTFDSSLLPAFFAENDAFLNSIKPQISIAVSGPGAKLVYTQRDELSAGLTYPPTAKPTAHATSKPTAHATPKPTKLATKAPSRKGQTTNPTPAPSKHVKPHKKGR